MIKQGVRKALKAQGTVLLVEKAYVGPVGGWWHGEPDFVGGDLLMMTGARSTVFKWYVELEVISVANAKRFWVEREWLIQNTSLAFDARVLEAARDA